MIFPVIGAAGGIAGLLAGYMGNMTALKICTVVACLFWLSPKYLFPMEKISIAALAAAAAMVGRRYFQLDIPGLGWMMADGLYLLGSVFALIDEIREWLSEHWKPQIPESGAGRFLYLVLKTAEAIVPWLVLLVFPVTGLIAAWNGHEIWMIIGTAGAVLLCPVTDSGFGSIVCKAVIIGLANLAVFAVSAVFGFTYPNLSWMICDGIFALCTIRRMLLPFDGHFYQYL